MREIITLQIGSGVDRGQEVPFAGGVGALSWRLATPCETLFRVADQQQQQQQQQPRALLFDVAAAFVGVPCVSKGSAATTASEKHARKVFQALSASAAMTTTGEGEGAATTWEADATVVVKRGEERFARPQWRDYFDTTTSPGVVFNPRSINVVHRYGDPGHFDMHPMGVELFSTSEASEQKEKFVDSVRYFLEECDSLQGIQALIDVNSGFSGMGAVLLQEVREEIGRTRPLLGFGFSSALEPPQTRTALGDAKEILNMAFAFSSFSEVCSMYVPIYPSLRRRNQHQETLNLAASLDTISLPFREPASSPNFISMFDMISSLTKVIPSANIGSLQAAFPQTESKSYPLENFSQFPGMKDPNLALTTTTTFGSYSVYRGTSERSNRSQQQSLELFFKSPLKIPILLEEKSRLSNVTATLEVNSSIGAQLEFCSSFISENFRSRGNVGSVAIQRATGRSSTISSDEWVELSARLNELSLKYSV